MELLIDSYRRRNDAAVPAVCVPDQYHTCGPGVGLWTEVNAPTLSLWSGSNLVVAPNGNLAALGFNSTGSFAAYSYLSIDDGATWTQTAQAVNAEYRVSAVGTDRIVCVAGNSSRSNRCAVSTDNGVTWAHYTSMPASQYWYALAFGNGKFIAGIYDSGTLATSTNGVTWGTQATSMAGVDCLAYGAGTWIAGSRNSNNVWRSTDDGVTWSSVLVSGATPIRATYCGGRFFLLNSGAATDGIRYSSDGITWSVTQLPFSVWVLAVSYTGTHYVCLGWTSGGSYYVFFSPDLRTWSWWAIAASSSNFTTEPVLTASGLLISQGFRGGKAGLVDTANVAGPRTVLSIHADTDPPIDQSCYQTKTLTLTGSASISAAESKFGGKSILVPNVGTSTFNGLVVTDHIDFDFGTSDLTIDLHAYRIANTYVGTLFYGTFGGGEFSVKVGTDGGIDLVYRSSGGSQSFFDVAIWPLGRWVYFVAQRRGVNWETYLNGALIHSAAITGGAGSTVNSGGDLFFGRTNASSAQSWDGYLDDIRVTQGATRSFTPPAMTFCESAGSTPPPLPLPVPPTPPAAFTTLVPKTIELVSWWGGYRSTMSITFKLNGQTEQVFSFQGSPSPAVIQSWALPTTPNGALALEYLITEGSMDNNPAPVGWTPFVSEFTKISPTFAPGPFGGYTYTGTLVKFQVRAIADHALTASYEITYKAYSYGMGLAGRVP